MLESLSPVLRDFIITLATGLLGVVSAALIALAKKGFDLMSEKIDGLKNEHARLTFAEALNNLNTIVTTTVTALQQTLGDEIRKSIENNDGVYTREDLLALKDKALTAVKSQLSDAAKKAIQSVYNDLDDFISDLIEAKVRELKESLVEGK